MRSAARRAGASELLAELRDARAVRAILGREARVASRRELQRRRNRRSVAVELADGSRFVVKYYWRAELVAQEAARLAAANRLAAIDTPRLRGCTRHHLVQDFVPGEGLDALAKRTPREARARALRARGARARRDPRQQARRAGRPAARRALRARTPRRAHAPRLARDRGARLRALGGAAGKRARGLAPGLRRAADREARRAISASTGDACVLGHGDFQPRHLLLTPDDRLFVVDWIAMSLVDPLDRARAPAALARARAARRRDGGLSRSRAAAGPAAGRVARARRLARRERAALRSPDRREADGPQAGSRLASRASCGRSARASTRWRKAPADALRSGRPESRWRRSSLRGRSGRGAARPFQVTETREPCAGHDSAAHAVLRRSARPHELLAGCEHAGHAQRTARGLPVRARRRARHPALRRAGPRAAPPEARASARLRRRHGSRRADRRGRDLPHAGPRRATTPWPCWIYREFPRVGLLPHEHEELHARSDALRLLRRGRPPLPRGVARAVAGDPGRRGGRLRPQPRPAASRASSATSGRARSTPTTSTAT